MPTYCGSVHVHVDGQIEDALKVEPHAAQGCLKAQPEDIVQDIGIGLI